MNATALVYPAAGDVRLEERVVGEPAPGEILCAARLSLVSTGTELTCLRGEFDARTFWERWVQYPFDPGYSMVADVIAVGAGVAGVRVGDRIASATPHASRFLVPASEATVLTDDIPDECAVWASLAVTTQWAVRRARIELGERVAVVGAGLLGQLLVRYLRVAGAGRVVAIDTDASRLALARDGGAHEAVGRLVDDLVAERSGEFDAVFDVTGHPSSFAPSSELLRPLGRLVLVGDSPRPSTQALGPRIVGDGISIIGVHTATTTVSPSPADPWSSDAMLRVFFELVRDGRIDPRPLITHRHPAADAPEVYRALLEDRSGRVGIVLDWRTHD